MSRKKRPRPRKSRRQAEDSGSLAARATESRRRGENEEALDLCRRALALDPDDAQVLHLIGSLELERGNGEAAYRFLEAAVARDSFSAPAQETLAEAAAATGRFEMAAVALKRVVEAIPGNLAALGNLGSVLLRLDRRDEAAAAFEQALAMEPRSVPVLCNLAILRAEAGDYEAARALYGRVFEAAPDDAEAYHDYSRIKTFQPGDPDLAAMERLRARPDLDSERAMFLDFALAKAFQDMGDWDAAFRHVASGNRLKRATLAFDFAKQEALVDDIISVFDAAFIEARQGAGFDDPRPIFIVGMPRSGTTLVEQILAALPGVHGLGEINQLRDVISGRGGAGPGVRGMSAKGLGFPAGVVDLGRGDFRRLGEAYMKPLAESAPEALRLIDKMPQNFFFVGLIHLALPGARIVHCVRGPMDTCLSCYQIHFTVGQEFTYDLTDLGRYYRLYHRLMDHWRAVLPGRFLDLSYEDLVARPEPRMRELLDFCELEWDETCLDFHKIRRPVSTASAHQVHQPIYRTAVERWRRYEGHLGALRDALGPLADDG